MNRKLLKFGAVIAVIALLSAAVFVVNAQGGMPRGRGHGHWHEGMGEHSLIAVAAEALGMEQDELLTVLEEGKTIAEVAAEKGVELDVIVDAFIAQHTEHLAAQVEAGRFTQEEADAMLETMRDHVTAHLSETFEPGSGYGRGMMGMHGMGMMHGHGMGGMMGPNGDCPFVDTEDV
jgi:hypothetical protein